MPAQPSPWPALYAVIVGFFMLLLDMSIVAVANPAIMADLHADLAQVIWATSAYLLAYAVPLLITGRLGDRFGPKNVYLIGLVVFTGSSLWCGAATSIDMLIAARVAQGLGAALMTPQTMAVITRTFPPDKRGAAMGLWGGTAGLAALVGPILGGVLVDWQGWEWIFLVNVPVGILAFVLAAWLVPALETHRHRFDLAGMALSAIGMFLLVFGIQEGNARHWSPLIWALIVAGVAALILFVVNQHRNTREPLVPLSLFKDRNFTLSNVAVTSMASAVNGLFVVAYFYLQQVRDMSPTESAMVFAPMALLTGLLAPFIGKIADRLPPRMVPTIGFALFAGTLFGYVSIMTPDSPIALFVVIGAIAGIANAFVWAPLAANAIRNLSIQQAGAGSAVFLTTRQLGFTLGSAAISALLSAHVAAQGLPARSIGESGTTAGNLSPELREATLHKMSTALSQSMYLPALILLVGLVASALFVGVPRTTGAPKAKPAAVR
ncbi:DHA2 family efflux MFS transporter permease subunit [Actinophytocola oryzae]|uniref:EmrB/QacA subfamily drug resistance transporter n=1 Tax=Actinophytocola oryzae TaxID=502181 RepID=A0A4R7W1N5_9PSEU|nr:DHA2 family efflux MFS transporter permease subunit [Actinophytocola oryzae]TDV56025.1 EmrB/QacA subfamily drug resistance transporter [Actinophytocola oryzae]